MKSVALIMMINYPADDVDDDDDDDHYKEVTLVAKTTVVVMMMYLWRSSAGETCIET